MPATPTIRHPALRATAATAVVWLALVIDWMAFDQLPEWLRLGGMLGGMCIGVAWLAWSRGRSLMTQAVVGTLAYPPLWAAAVAIADWLVWDGLRSTLAQGGVWGLYLIGLVWVIWGLEQATQFYESQRARERSATDHLEEIQPHILLETRSDKAINNPLDPSAWYYGNRSRKLNQSITALMSYSGLFSLLVALLTQLQGCHEAYEMPAGGGGGTQASLASAAMPQAVKIQKIVKRKFVINPFSSIKKIVAPIEDIDLQIKELTEHQYSVAQGQTMGFGTGDGFGYGDGDGNGFGGGTQRGKVRFIRLEYSGGDWDQDFGVGADLNMLTEYGIRTKHKINTETESRTITQLKNFTIGKSPPFVYMTGQRSISFTENERKILREYLLDKHGMIFCDNGGSRHFHAQFIELMNRVLEGKVEPVPVALDDPIHTSPYRIPFLPYVAPHGGKEALGWKVDGRWVAYYSPGDIADAWSDGHAGVKPEIAEYCYQLGTNVIFYAHMEYSKWLFARQKK